MLFGVLCVARCALFVVRCLWFILAFAVVRCVLALVLCFVFCWLIFVFFLVLRVLSVVVDGRMMNIFCLDSFCVCVGSCSLLVVYCALCIVC